MALSLYKSIIHWRLVPSTSLPQKALMDIDIALGALSIGAFREYALLGIVLSLTKRLWIMCLVRQSRLTKFRLQTHAKEYCVFC